MVRLLAYGWRRRGDVALVIAVVGLDLVLFSTLLNTGVTTGSPAGLLLGYALMGGAILFWQRRSTLSGYAGLWLHAVGSVALTGYRPTLPLLVGLYLVAAHTAHRPTALVALLASVGPVGLAVVDGIREAPPGETLATFIGLSTLLTLVHCGVFVAGRWMRRFRERTRALEQQRVTAARDAVGVERARIANELHDIVGHSVTVMTLQAAAARKVMRRDPARADEALARISGAGAQTVSELRRMLGGLGPGELSSLHRIGDLLNGVRATGVTVAVSSVGSPRRTSPAVDLAAYRIIQEALTNVVKHAGPGACATIVLSWQPGSLAIDVTDDGRGRPADAAVRLSAGYGLAGLTARVTALGGRFESGQMAEGGFRVRATLPIELERSESAVAHPAG